MSDYLGHKFNSQRDEDLYGETPSDQVGSVDEIGWYGLYLNEDSGGVILSEDSNGFVDGEEFATDLEINDRWHELQREYEVWDESANDNEGEDEQS